MEHDSACCEPLVSVGPSFVGPTPFDLRPRSIHVSHSRLMTRTTLARLTWPVTLINGQHCEVCAWCMCEFHDFCTAAWPA